MESDIKKSLECTVCYLEFNNELQLPKVLNCGHNVCAICCSHLFKENVIKCPICNKTSQYVDLDAITLNIFVK